MCSKPLSKQIVKQKVFLHTTLGAKLVRIQKLRCQHKINNIPCNTQVQFHKYTSSNNQYLTYSQPLYLLIGKTHLYDIHYVKHMALQQLLHGNGVKLLTMQAKITEQHKNTPNLDYTIQGTRKISPSPSADNIASVIKLWMLLRYIGTHTPKITNKFPKKWTIEEIITSLASSLHTFNLRPHTPSSTYLCTRNVFVIDGTCKIAFLICGVIGCMQTPSLYSNTCHHHKQYKNITRCYTGNNNTTYYHEQN